MDKFGERGAVDLTSVMGYYCFVSMVLNVNRYPCRTGRSAGTEARFLKPRSVKNS